MLTPRNKPASMMVVGRVTGFGERIVDIISGGIDVTLSEARTVILEPHDKPGETVEFTTQPGCPSDQAGDQLYLVYLQWVRYINHKVGLDRVACTPVDPATSVGIADQLHFTRWPHTASAPRGRTAHSPRATP